VVRIKWLPGNFSRLHFHNSDRFFVVISGNWWDGTALSQEAIGYLNSIAGLSVYY